MTIRGSCSECDYEIRVDSVKEIISRQREHQDRAGIEHVLDYERED